MENQENSGSAGNTDTNSDDLLIPALSFPSISSGESDSDFIGDEYQHAGLDFGKVGETKPNSAHNPGDIVDTGWSLPKIVIPAAGEAPAEDISAGETETLDPVSTEAVPAPSETTQTITAVSSPVLIPDAAATSTPPKPPQFDEIIAPTSEDDDPEVELNRALHQGTAANTQVSTAAKLRKRLIVIGAVVVMTIALIAAIAGITMVRKNNAARTHASVLLACSASFKDYSVAKAALDKATADSVQAQQVSADQVADASSIQQLQQALSEGSSMGSARTCSDSMTDSSLNAAASANRELTAVAKAKAAAITEATQAVTASAQSKEIGEAKTALQTKVTSAQARYEQTANVASNETRAALKTALDTAQSLIDSESVTVDAINAASGEIDTALAAVNTSANEAETAANSANGNSTGTGTGTTRPRGRTQNSYAPATTGGTTPATPPSAGSSGSGTSNSGEADNPNNSGSGDANSGGQETGDTGFAEQ